jgi:hypothetical protein
MLKNNKKSVGLALFFICVMAMLALVIWANKAVQFSQLLLNDEYLITFKTVKHLLHPQSLQDFWAWISVKGFSSYGRFMYYVSAIFSYFPEKIWGEAGQIFATRMLFSTVLLASNIIFSVNFVKSWTNRILMFMILSTMPYSSYYLSMPKPESWQMLAYALFFIFWYKKLAQFGWWYFFLGFVFGAKVSALPVIFVIICISLWVNRSSMLKSIPRILEAFCYGLFGFLINAPQFYPIIGITIIGVISINYSVKYFPPIFSTIVGVIFFVLVLLLFKYQIGTIRLWLNDLHGPYLWANLYHLSLSDHVKYILQVWLSLPKWWLGILLWPFLGISYGCFIMLLHRKRPQDSQWPLIVAIGLSGLLLNIILIFKMTGILRFYLYPGTYLFIVSFIVLYDQTYMLLNRQIQNLIFACLFMVMTFWFMASYELLPAWRPFVGFDFSFKGHAYRLSCGRDIEAHNSKRKKEIIFLTNFLNGLSIDQHFQVVLSPTYVLLPDTERYNVRYSYWQDYTYFDEMDEVMVILQSELSTPPHISLPSQYPVWEKFISDYKRLVVDKDQKSDLPQYYERVQTLPNGYEILVLRKNKGGN